MHLQNTPKPLLPRFKAMVMNQHILQNGTSPVRYDYYPLLLLALIPSILVGIWNSGVQMCRFLSSTVEANLIGWQASLTFDFCNENDTFVWPLLLGVLYFIPLLLASLFSCILVSRLFGETYSYGLRNGHLTTSLIFVLLLPPSMSLTLVVLGMSFGIIFGQIAFGGFGRHLVHPALLGIVFLIYSYPGYFNGQYGVLPLDQVTDLTAWQAIVGTASGSSMELFDSRWLDVFLYDQIGNFGTTSALASMSGLFLLMIFGRVPWLIPFSAMSALYLTSQILLPITADGFEPIYWYWHLVVGSYAFTLAFLLTDPVVRPVSRLGQISYGMIFGFLTVVIRMANPEHPEGSLFALLFASMLVPLFDWFGLEIHRSLRSRRAR